MKYKILTTNKIKTNYNGYSIVTEAICCVYTFSCIVILGVPLPVKVTVHFSLIVLNDFKCSHLGKT